MILCEASGVMYITHCRMVLVGTRRGNGPILLNRELNVSIISAIFFCASNFQRWLLFPCMTVLRETPQVASRDGWSQAQGEG